MILKLATRHDTAACCFVISAVAASNDDDAAACGTRRGLDHELIPIANKFSKSPDIATAPNNSVCLGDGNTVLMADLLGQRFIVDARIERARVARLNKRHVAMIDAQD